MLIKELETAIANALQSKLQQPVTMQACKQVAGGDINQTFMLQTTAGKFFVKVNGAGMDDMFEKESNGLQLLAQVQAFTVPQPITTGNGGGYIFLVMEYIQKGSASADFWQRFGHALAALHSVTRHNFGLDESNYIGIIPQHNYGCATWAQFYASQRILPLMRQALQQGKCSMHDMQAVEKLCGRFDDLFPAEPPALLHGDLWSGNFMVDTDGKPVIYDPAVYYGHREMDIAMTLLFGGFDTKLYYHYNEAYPLQPCWRQRVPLCQLYPLLVHLLLFGGHYYTSVMEIVRRY